MDFEENIKVKGKAQDVVQLDLGDCEGDGYLDEGDGEVVRRGVEPLDGGDHAGVVHRTQELRLQYRRFLFFPLGAVHILCDSFLGL